MPAPARSAAAAAAALLPLCGRAAAHAVLNKPLSRNGLACAENTKEAHPCTPEEIAWQDGIPFGMARGGKAAFQGEGWFSNHVDYVGNATLLSKEHHDLLTYCTKGGVPPDYLDCDWSLHTTDTKGPGGRPWRAPGTAPVYSPCGAVGGEPTAVLGTTLPPVPAANRSTWTVGGTESVAFGFAINHGGGFSFRLCPASEQLTEACFQRTPLRFVGDTQDLVGVNGSLLHTIPARRTADSHWTMNPIPISERFFPAPAPGAVGCGYACPGEVPQDNNKIYNFNIVNRVEVPAGIPPGDYVLGWRWDCEQTPEVWCNCADITIVAAGPATPAPAPTPRPPAPAPTPVPVPPACPAQLLNHTGLLPEEAPFFVMHNSVPTCGECCAQCAADTLCTSFTWWWNNFVCGLRHGAVPGKWDNGGTWVSGVMQSPTPPTPPGPAPAPTPVPAPAPAPSTCPGGSLDACIEVCPASPVAVYVACCKNCGDKCGAL